jgi:hypothetical protein
LLKEAISWHIGDLDDVPEKVLPHPTVAPWSMLAGRTGVYLQAESLSAVAMTNMLFQDFPSFTNISNVTNPSSGLPEWFIKLNPTLDAAVVLPLEVGTYGPSLVVEIRGDELSIINQTVDPVCWKEPACTDHPGLLAQSASGPRLLCAP